MNSQINDVIDRWKQTPSDIITELSELTHTFEAQNDWRSIVYAHGAALLLNCNIDMANIAPSLVKVLQDLLQQTEGVEKNLLYVAIGDVYQHWIHDRESAMSAYQQAFHASREHTACLGRARQIYSNEGDYHRVVSLFEHEIKIATSEEHRAYLFTQLAQVYADEMGDYDSAIENLNKLNGLEHDEALAGELLNLYHGGTSLAEFVDILLEKAASLADEDPKQSSVDYLRAAQIEWNRPTGHVDRSLLYAELATKCDAENQEVQELLKELKRKKERILWPADAFLPNPEGLKEYFEELSKPTNGTNDTPEEEVSTDTQSTKDLGSEGEEVNPPEEGASDVDSEDGSETATLDQKESQNQEEAGTTNLDLGETSTYPLVNELRAQRDAFLIDGKLDEAVALYEKRVKRLRRQPEEAEVMADLARLLWLDVEDWDKADYYFKRLKLLDSSNPDVETFYTEYYERGGEWRKLLVLLMNGAAEASTVEEKRSYTRRLAALGEGPMESTKTAIDAWRTFQKDAPNDSEAFSELKRLYKEDKKWSAYIDVLRTEYEQLEDSEFAKRISILEEIKDIYGDELKIEPMLIATLQELLEIDPENRRAFDELRERLEAGRRYTDLAELLENQALKSEKSGDYAGASEHYLEVANMWQFTLRNVSAALPHLERVLELDPDNLSIIDRSIELYNTRRDYLAVLKLYQRKAKLVDKEEAISLLNEASKLAQDRLRDPKVSGEILEEILQLVPDDFEAMKALKAIYDRGDNYQKQLDIRQHMLDHGFGDDAKILREVAMIASDKLDDDDTSIQAWKTVLELEPKNQDATQSLTLIYVTREAFDELEKLYINQAKALELFDILEVSAGSTEDNRVKSQIFQRMADVSENHLKDIERTIMSYESLKETSDEPVYAAKRLLELYGKIDDKHEQISQLQFLIDSLNNEERPYYLAELRDKYVEVEDLENALKTAAKLLFLNPKDDTTYQQALAIATTRATQSTLVKFLDRITASEKDQELTNLNHRRVAKLLIRLEEWDEAVDRLESLHRSFPDDLDIKRDLEVAYGGQGEPSKQVAILESIIELRKSSGATTEELVKELTRIADIERNALNQPEQAQQSYLHILDLVPNHILSLNGLEEIYRSAEQWYDVVQILERKRDALPFEQSHERLDVLYQMAEIYLNQLENPHAALDLCQEILSTEPNHQKGFDLVESMYHNEEVGYEATLLLAPYIREQKNIDKLVHNLETRIERSDDEFEKIDLYDQLIQLTLERKKVMEEKEVSELEGEEGAGDEEKRVEIKRLNYEIYRDAFEYARKQLAIDPNREDTWERLESLAGFANQLELVFVENTPYDEALETTFSHAIDDRLEPHSVVSLTRKIAQLRETKLYNHQGAIEAYQKLHEIDGYDLDAIDGLIRNYESLADSVNVATMIALKASIVSTPEEQVGWYLKAAEISDEILQDFERTEQYLKEAIFVLPDRYDIHRRLISLYEREERWESLAEQLRAYSEIESNEGYKEKALTDLAKLQWSELERFEQALDTYRELFLLVGTKNSLVQEVFAFDDTLKEDSAEHPIRLEVIDLIEPHVRGLENRQMLARVLQTRLIFTEDPYARAEQLDEYSRTLELLGRQEDALYACRDAVIAVADSEVRRERFQTLCERQQASQLFVETYARAIDELQDPFLAARMLVKKATWEVQLPDAIPQAIESLERARTFDETNLNAIKMLDDLYLSRQEYQNLARILQAKAILEVDAKDRVKTYRRLAHIQNDILEQKEAAVQTWNEVVAVLPNDIEAINSLEALYEYQERWIELTEILNRKIDANRDDQVRFHAMQKLANLYENQLEDARTAINELQRAHRLKPNNVDVLFELRRLLEGQREWIELDEILQKLLATEALQRAPELKAELLLQQGDLRSLEMFEIEKAIPTYLRILRFDFEEYRSKAIDALERISEDETYLDAVAEPLSSYNIAHERWESEVDLTRKLAHQASEPDRRSLLYQRLADLYSIYLNSEEDAYYAIIDAWKETPLNLKLYQRAKKQIHELKVEAHMAETISQQLVHMSDPKRLVELHLDLALLYEHFLNQRIEAEQQYREVLLLEQNNEHAQPALESILVSDERWFDLLELYEQRYQYASAKRGQEAATECLLQIANIYENMLADPIATVDAYRRVNEESPSNEIAREALIRLLREQHRWLELAEFIEENFSWFSPNAKRERKLELAQIHGNELMNPMISMEHYVEMLTPNQMFSLKPETEAFTTAVHAVEHYLHDDSFAFDTLLRCKAARLLLPIYVQAEAWESIAETREIIARTTEQPDEVLPHLLQSAYVYEHNLKDFERARKLRYEVLSKHPEEPQFLELIIDICFDQDDWMQLSEFIQEILTEQPALSYQVRRNFERTIFEIHEIRLNDIPEAIRLVKRSLENEPADAELLSTLERLLARTSDWQGLSEFYRQEAEFASNENKKIVSLRKLAIIYQNFLKEPDEAISALFEIQEIDPIQKNPHAAASAKDLMRILRHEERWFDLVELLQHLQESSPKLSYSLQLVDIYLNHLKHYEEAVDALEELLVKDPNDLDIHRQLRVVQRRLSSVEEDYGLLELRVVDLLLLHRPTPENINRTLELLELRVLILEDPFEKAETYLKIAEFLEQRPAVADRIRALIALCMAYQIRPHDTDVFKRITSLAERTDSWDRVPGYLLPGLRVLSEPDDQVQLLTAIAWVYREHLSDLTSTIVALQSVIDLDPANKAALDALEDSYRSNRQWKELIRILEIRVKEEHDAERRKQSLESLAHLNHTIAEKFTRAIENYEELRTIDPTNETYIQALEDLYRRTFLWQDLEDLLADYSNQLYESEQRISVLARLAEVQHNHTENIEGAIATNVLVLDLEPKNHSAMVALTDLFEKAQRWEQLLETLEQRIEYASDPVQRLDLRLQMAKVQAFKIGTPDEALEILRKVLKHDPFCQPAQNLLREMAGHQEFYQEAFRLLKDTFTSSEQWSKLEELYEHLLGTLDLSTFKEERREVYLTYDAFYQSRERSDEARSLARRAFEEFPTDPEILEVLRRVTQSDETIEERMYLLQNALEKDSVDLFEYRPTLELFAKTLADMGHTETAIEKWNAVLELDGFDVDALKALDELYVKTESYDELGEIIEREIGVVDAEEIPALRCRLAYLCETHFERKEEAFMIYSEVLEENPESQEALEGMVRLYQEPELTEQVAIPLAQHFRNIEEWERLAATIEGALEYLQEDTRNELRRELVDLKISRFDDIEGAYPYVCEAIVAEPNDYVLQEDAERYADSLNTEVQLAEVYATIEEVVDDPIRRIEILVYAGTQYLLQLHDFDKSEQLFEKVLEIDPENQVALTGLEDVARAVQNTDKLIDVLLRKAESVYETDVQIEAFAEVARLYAVQERYDEGIESYRKALSLDPTRQSIMEELEALLEVAQSYEDLVDLLEQHAQFEEDESKRFDILIRAAQFCEYFLKDTQRTMRFWEDAHALVPTDVKTMVALDKMYATEGMFDQRRGILEQLLRTNLSNVDRARYMKELGLLLDESYNDVETGIEYLKNAYLLARNPETRKLEAETPGTPIADVAFAHLQEIYAKNQRWEELNALFEERLAELKEDQLDEQIDLRARRADISAKHLGDTQGAITTLNELLTLSPNHYKTLLVLADLYHETGDFDSERETVDRLVESSGTSEQQNDSLRRRAKYFEERGDLDSAIQDYTRLIELHPGEQAAIERLKAIYESLGSWEEYLKVVEFELKRCSESEEKIKLLKRGYEVSINQLKDSSRAVPFLEKLRDVDDSPAVIEKLIHLYIEANETDKANKLITDAIERLLAKREMKEVVRYYHLQGKLAEQKQDNVGALEAYRNAHSVDASYLPNLLSMGQLLIRLEEWDEALKIYQTLLLHQMHVKDKNEKISIYYNLGVIRLQQGDERRAKDMFKRVLSIDRNHAESLKALENL